MNKKKMAISILLMIVLSIIIIGVIIQSYYQNINVQFNLKSDAENTIQLYHGNKTSDFNEVQSQRFAIPKGNEYYLLKTSFAYDDTNYLRIDFVDNITTKNVIANFDIYKEKNHQAALKTIENNITTHNCEVTIKENKLYVKAYGSDPYIVIKLDREFMMNIMNGNKKYLAMVILSAIFIINGFLIISYRIFRKNEFFLDLYNNKKLIWNLSKNDFKTKYAGSFFGILWAFVQPIVTIILYWFVFQVGLRSGDVGGFPFVLWLISGLVPWFFFQDAISAGTNCLIEYSYLVKKMVFKINILPFVKIISALFVHLFFIVFTFIIFAANGYYPSVYSIQILYYLFCALVLVSGIVFTTSAIIVFFKDLGQIVQIILQIGMWMTPIMWNSQIVPSSLLWLVQLNPMYYIVDGFRDSFINHIWFWNKLDLAVNFWLITIFIFILGITIFKKLKIHFADVL